MSQPSCRLLRIRQILEKTGLSRSSLYRKLKTGDFLEPVSLGDRSVAWVEADLDAWIQSRPPLKESRNGPAK